jgi:hypothetical protein
MSAPICEKRLRYNGYHFYACGKPAKYKVSHPERDDRHICGIHARRLKRLIENGHNSSVLTPIEKAKP